MSELYIVDFCNKELVMMDAIVIMVLVMVVVEVFTWLVD